MLIHAFLLLAATAPDWGTVTIRHEPDHVAVSFENSKIRHGEERTSFTGWIFPLTGGETEILTLGRRFADGMLEPMRRTGSAKPCAPPTFRRVAVHGRTCCCSQDVKTPADLNGDGNLDIVGIAWDSYPKLHNWRNDAIRRDAK